MTRLFFILLLSFYSFTSFAQERKIKELFDRVEITISNNEINIADSLMQTVKKDEITADSMSYCYYSIIGRINYFQKNFEKSKNALSQTLSLLDSMQIWDCENYIKYAYYLADSYLETNDLSTSENIINETMIKCASIWEECEYSKKMLKLLLIINKDTNDSSPIIEEIHNEIQEIALNVYANRTNSNEAKEYKKSYKLMCGLIKDRSKKVSDDDFYRAYFCIASYMQLIKEYEEAARLFALVKDYYSDKKTKESIYSSLLAMYASIAQKDSIDKLLPEIFEFCDKYNIDKDQYSENVYVGYMMNNNGHYEDAQIYYEHADEYLNEHPDTPDWKDKKLNILSKMIINQRSLTSYERTLSLIDKYESLADIDDFYDYHFINFERGIALMNLNKYDQALAVFENVRHKIDTSNIPGAKDEFMSLLYLGICYLENGQYKKSIKIIEECLSIIKDKKIDKSDLFGYCYLNLGRCYLMLKDYKKAMSLLNSSADIQLKTKGYIGENTIKYINECK